MVATFSGLLSHRQRHILTAPNLYKSNYRQLYHLHAFVHFVSLREAVLRNMTPYRPPEVLKDPAAASIITLGDGASSSILWNVEKYQSEFTASNPSKQLRHSPQYQIGEVRISHVECSKCTDVSVSVAVNNFRVITGAEVWSGESPDWGTLSKACLTS